jgi:hypothetical protein
MRNFFRSFLSFFEFPIECIIFTIAILFVDCGTNAPIQESGAGIEVQRL